MMEDTFDSVLDDSDVEEEAQEEVDKVLFELTDGLLGATTSSHVPQVRRLWHRLVVAG
jgi:charged multivesicular body protein 3